MTDDKRTEQQIIAEAYSDEARATWKAPVQVGRGGKMYIPWDIHLEAYEAYCKKWSHQTALIDLKGRGCRGGFGTEELDGFVPGWRDRVSAIGKMQTDYDAAYGHATRLLDALMIKHFPERGALSKLPTIIGVLDQIDNLTTAFIRADALKIVGYMVWNKLNPDSREFSKTPLTNADKANGYCQQTVYATKEPTT